MELRRVLTVLLRRWWLVAGLPVVVLLGSLAASSSQPYQATVRAEILLPADPEDPGNAERPELMIMDDGPIVMTSPEVAELVRSALDSPIGGGPMLDTAEIQDSLSSERFSRILTITATRDDPDEALAIGQAVATVLDDAVNTFMVAEGATKATVRIIENPEEAIRDVESRRLVMVVQTLVALAAGAGLAAFAAALDERLYAENVATALGLPILADVRSGRRRWFELRLPWGGHT